MKKKIISILTNPALTLLFFMTFLYPLIIIFLTEPDGSKVLLYFKALGYILAFELLMTLFVSIIAGIIFLVFYIYDKNVEKKKINIQNKNKESLIQKFSLEENEYTEVFGFLPDCTENKKVLLKLINESNGKNTELFVNVSNKVHSISLDSVLAELPISFFTDILTTIGFRFYLSLKNNEEKDIVLSIIGEKYSYNLLIEPILYSLFLEEWHIV